MKDRYEEGLTFQEFLDSAEANVHLWTQIYQRARLPDDVLDRALEMDGEWYFLALSEDWCGDAVNTLPHLARLVEAVPHFHLRILSRDENPDLMDAHLTDGTRSIPVVMILDEDFREVKWWGPRPGPLQALFLREIKPLPKPERYPRVRAWYARDRGRTTLREILGKIPVED